MLFLQGFGFDLFDFFSGLLGFFQSIIAFLLQAVIFIWNTLVLVATFIWNALVATVEFLFRAFRVLLRGLVHVINDVIHLRFGHLLDDFFGLLGRLKPFFDRLRRIIHLLHRLQQQYVIGALRRMINLIQRVRRILVIFRIFHLRFADRLDRKLVGIEQRVVSKFLLVIAFQNRILNILELIMDPSGIIRRNVTVRSVLDALNDLLLAITGHDLNHFFGPGVTIAGVGNKTLDFRALGDEIVEAAVEKRGDLYEYGQAVLRDFQNLGG